MISLGVINAQLFLVSRIFFHCFVISGETLGAAAPGSKSNEIVGSSKLKSGLGVLSALDLPADGRNELARDAALGGACWASTGGVVVKTTPVANSAKKLEKRKIISLPNAKAMDNRRQNEFKNKLALV